MADTHEADHPSLSAGAVRDLFAQLPVPGKDVVWLADQVLAIAQHLGSLTFEHLFDNGVHSLVCRAGSEPPFSPGRHALRLFRPLLARFAVLGADETGGEPQLYGGRYSLVRSSRIGPVQLDIEFTNTPGSQRLAITRVPIPQAQRTGSAPAAGAADAPPQPSA
jgi:hypothetical protein